MSAVRAASKPAGVLAQLRRFVLVGGVAASVDYGSVLVFIALWDWPELARALSFVCGSTTAYLLNRRWTFDSRRDTREVGLVAVAHTLSFLIVMVVNTLALRLFPDEWWTITVAWMLSQSMGTTFNFAVQRLVVFRR